MAERGSGRKKSKPSSSSTLPSLPAHAAHPPPAPASSAGTSDAGVTMTHDRDTTSSLAAPLAGSSRRSKEKKRKREANSAEQDSPLSAHHQVITEGQSELRQVQAGDAAQINHRNVNSDTNTQAAPNGHEEGEANGSRKRKKRNRRRKSGPANGLPGDVESPCQTPPVETVHNATGENNATNSSFVQPPETAEQAETPHLPDDSTATPLGTSDEDMAKYMRMSAPLTTTHRADDKHPTGKSTRKAESARATHPQETNSPSGKVAEEIAALKTQLETAKAEAERQAEALKLQIEELEGKVKTGKQEGDAKDEVIKTNERVRELLKDAVSCGVCFETLNDPHTLSCGHVACRVCLVSWFRTPGAYVHTVPDPIPEDMDLSYWTKVCHVCRTYIVNRPIRMYHLQSILEPLGIDTHIPIALQTAKAGSAEDPWRNSFPEDKDSYRMHDDSDKVFRCPACLGEIDEGSCSHCGAQFSEEEEVEDFDSVDENEDDDGDDGSEIQYLGSDDGSPDRGDEHHGPDASAQLVVRQTRARSRPRGGTATAEESDGSDNSDIVPLEHPRRSRRIGSSRLTSPRSGRRGDRGSRGSSGTGDDTIADDVLSQSGDSDSDPLPARPRRPSPRRHRRNEQLIPRRRRDRAGSSDRLRDYLDMFAGVSDDDGMTQDEGDDPVGETGDYGYSSTGEERSSDGERRDDSEESAYEGSFIDDDDDDISGPEGETGDGREDGIGQSDSDSDDLEDSVILRGSRRAGSRIGGARRDGRGSRSDEDSGSEGGSEVGLDEMRRRRLLAYGRQGR